jgi:hypothetical protein
MFRWVIRVFHKRHLKENGRTSAVRWPSGNKSSNTPMSQRSRLGTHHINVVLGYPVTMCKFLQIARGGPTLFVHSPLTVDNFFLAFPFVCQRLPALTASASTAAVVVGMIVAYTILR